MFYVDPGTAVSVATTLFDNRNRLLKTLGKLTYWLQHRTLSIAVFGPGGVGKTTLGQLLSMEQAASGMPSKPSKYTMSLGTEDYPLPGSFVGGLIVLPGQASRISEYWPEAYRNLIAGKTRIVINVVAWGYHSFTFRSYRDAGSFRTGMSKDQFMEAYLKEQRQQELEILESLVPRLSDAKRKIWMITLVTKQDLWWNDRAEVQEYYEHGEYGKMLQQVINKRGETNFPHEFLSASLVMNNFATESGELLAPTTEGYDQNIQQANLSQLFTTVTTFASRPRKS